MPPFAARLLLIVLLALALAGCPAQRPAPEEAPVATPPPEVPLRSFPGAQRYDVVGKESLVTILAYRGGKLAAAGHNHVIASHDVHGTIYLHAEPAKSGFDLVIPVGLLTVDEDELRKEAGPEFAAEVPDKAKEGTRRNMLGPGLLDAQRFPGIGLSSVEVTGSGSSLQVRTQVRVKDQVRELTVPVEIERQGDRVIGTGELAVRQSELGLQPFSIMGGLLAVQDEMRIRFRIVGAPATRQASRGTLKSIAAGPTREP